MHELNSNESGCVSITQGLQPGLKNLLGCLFRSGEIITAAMV